MVFCFDTEFTDLSKDGKLISIGIIEQYGNASFYAEFNDYDVFQCSNWIHDNVIRHLLWNQYHTVDLNGLYWEEKGIQVLDAYESYEAFAKRHVRMKGNTDMICNALIKWLDWVCPFKNAETERLFVSDCSHYDLVLLIDLFGSAFDFPAVPVCHDINQDLAYLYQVTDGGAFNIDREKMLFELYGIKQLEDTPARNLMALKDRYMQLVHEPLSLGAKHNALWDAFVILNIYDMCQKELKKIILSTPSTLPKIK